MLYVTSDLHGYPLGNFLRLLEKARFSDADQLIVLGDAVDRGAEGVALLRWVRETPNARMLLGNHEAMMLDCRFLFDGDGTPGGAEQEKALARWRRNGAEPTIDALRRLRHSDEAAFEAVWAYAQGLPLYEKAGRCVLTHAGLGHFAPDKPLDAYARDDLIWHRPAVFDWYYPDATVVFGHTPTGYYGARYAGRMLRTRTWIDIDTGAGSGGHPMLLRLEDEQAFYQDAEN